MDTVTSKDGTAIVYDKTGAGPPLVLVTGAFGYRRFPGQTFVVGLMRLMPGVWRVLKGLAHALPYDAALLDGFMAGRPLSTSAWRTVTMPTLVLGGTHSPASLRHAAEELARVLPNARRVSKKELGRTKKLDAAVIAAELTALYSP
ncbi:hypothetical protein IDH44_02285 [Paenibacillus sp. IB182496]|uniref:Uncharacterized protein n=1 Tax=Paenibacillus sabuli TaxID=2772509 RepID=A0A927GQQ3_9BACL|nr:hypothetical protein [Paenibacillus sabuli]MBD2844007.1 hypothetical protein [Paenibacillus sabuli]